jgi:hypothetical protein
MDTPEIKTRLSIYLVSFFEVLRGNLRKAAF